MLVYRVAPHDPTARRGRPNHPLTPSAHQGGGRWDNPSSYLLLYLSAHADGAVAETFQNLTAFTSSMFRHPGSGLDRWLITYDLPSSARLCVLDDLHVLRKLEVRPSRIVTKNTATTQPLAQQIFDLNTYDGIQWWSSIDADMVVVALWNIALLRVLKAEPLDIAHPAVAAAATRLAKRT